jgi:glycosyltransferase involved in cell wall biosynthesis
MGREQLGGKKVVCHIENDVLWLMQQPYLRQTKGIVSLWIAQSLQAFRQLCSLGLPVRHVPYAVDTASFRPRISGDTTADELRRRWQIPSDRFLIGNFMRDTLGSDLAQPKEQKGADVFLAICQALCKNGLPIHVLLAGPRRHWLRARLTELRIPFSFAGTLVETDDLDINILDKATLNQLYHLLDIYLVTSRWEGGPRPILEAAAARCRVISTPVGLAPDVLDPICIYLTISQCIDLISREIHHPFLASTLDQHYQRVQQSHTPEANIPCFREVYAEIHGVPRYQPTTSSQIAKGDQIPSRSRLAVDNVVRRLSRKLGWPLSPGKGLSISLWHEFVKPPYGGGNQFMLALREALVQLGVKIHDNRLGADIDVHLCNSTWFDVAKLTDFSRRNKLRMLHRIDGPIALYRGSDRDLDDQIFAINAQLGSATILQSGWSCERLCEMGYRPVNPVIIRNAVSSRFFHSIGRVPFDRQRKIRLIATSWSDNPRKGGSVYKWLEEHLDWRRFEFTFVGRTQEHFTIARHLPAVASAELAEILRQHDIYITASQRDPCSNALIEALACKLPALYLNDGGHPELVGQGGLPFTAKEEILPQLERLVEHYELFQSLIVTNSIESVARAYLEVAHQVMDA